MTRSSSQRCTKACALVFLATFSCLLQCSACARDRSARLALRTQRRADALHSGIKLQLPVVNHSNAKPSSLLIPKLLPQKVLKASPSFPDTTSSAAWAPLIVSGPCSEGMAPAWAPCIKDTVNKGAEDAGSKARITHAEELIFPDFDTRIPIFAKEADKVYWLQKVASEFGRACIHGDFLAYKGQHGQNLVFSNALYQGMPANDIWTSNCMHPDVSHRGFGTEAADTAAPGDGMDFPSIAIAASPDSWSFQHFQDRVTHIILQGKHLTHTDTTYITGKEPASTVVSALWEKLVPGSKKRVLHTSAQRWPIRAKELLFSCRAPLIHPWFAHKLAEEVGVVKWQKPLADRKVVLYCSRARDKGGKMQNGGRQFINDDDVITALGTLLTVRAQGERLEVYDINKWNDNFDSMVQYFASNVRAIIGPHGGALVNLNWAPRDIAVIEVMPSDFFSLALYEQASVLGQTYGFMQSPSINPRNDMTVDIPELMGLVELSLGKERDGGVLHMEYEWHTDARKVM